MGLLILRTLICLFCLFERTKMEVPKKQKKKIPKQRSLPQDAITNELSNSTSPSSTDILLDKRR